jgi:hypothetical protein
MAEENLQEKNIVPNNVPQETVDPLAPNANLFAGITDSPQQDVELSQDFDVDQALFGDQDMSFLAAQVNPGWTPNMDAASSYINTGYSPTYLSPQEKFQSLETQNSESDIDRLMNQVYSQPSTTSDKLSPNNVQTFGFKSSNFDRFYNHPNFDKLGFHPYRNNEEYYNENSTWWDDNQRMWGQWGKVFGTGFMSTYDALGDAMQGNYLSADVEGADSFAEAMRIGNTTRGGVGGFATNLALNAGYTVGILANIAVEEVALAFLEAGTVGGATPIVASRTAYNIARLGRVGDKIKDAENVSEALLKTVKNVDNAKSFWLNAGLWTADKLTPNTYKAIKSWKTAENTAKALSTAAKVAKTAGGFYRDMRMVNLAVAESKLEAGMVKNDFIAEHYADYKANNNGDNPSADEIAKIVEESDKAAFTTLMWNFPIIFASNMIVFDGALRGFRGINKVLNATKKSASSQILESTGKQMGKKGTSKFYDGGTSRWGRVKQRGLNGNLSVFGGELLRYTLPNSVEGFQEIFQEAIAVGAKDYYGNIYKDPGMAGLDAQLASIKAGLGSQMSGQGFEVFMSGFLMGGLVQGPQKAVFEWAPQMYEKYMDPKAYAKYEKERDDYINETVKVLNEVYENPEEYFSPEKINAVAQKMANEEMFDASLAGSVLNFMDAKDKGLFQHLHTVLSSGKAYEFRSQLEDFLKLDDQGLAEAFPNATAEEVKSGKTRERINSMMTNLDSLEKSFKQLNDEIINPYNPSDFEVKSREWNEEVIKQAAFNHSKMLALYTRDTFKRALERSNQMYKDMAADPVVANLSRSDLDVLTSMNDLVNEINLLKTNIKIFGETEGETTQDQKDINKNKIDRLALLQTYFGVLTDPKNVEKAAPVFVPKEGETPEEEAERKKEQSIQAKIIIELRERVLSDQQVNIPKLKGLPGQPFGMFNEENIKSLKDPFVKFLQSVANTNDEFINSDKIDETLLKIVDYKFLKGRAEDYNKAIQYIMSPGKLNDMVDKFTVTFKQAFEENKRGVRERIEKYVDQTEKNNVLNALSKLEVYPDMFEVEQWLKGEGPMPHTFFNKKGEIIFTDPKNKALADKIENIIGVYENTARKKESESFDVEEQEDFDDVRNDEYNYDDNFTPKVDDETGEIVDDNIDFESGVSLGKQHLAKEYRKYQKNAKGTPMSYRDWRESSAAKRALRTAVAINKLYKELYDPAFIQGEKADFKEWLIANEDTDNVQSILKLTDTTVEQITGTSTKKVPKKYNAKKNTQRKKVVDKKGKGHSSGLNIQQTTIPKEEGDVQMYRIVDNNGDPINDDVYGSVEDATNSRNQKVRQDKKEEGYKLNEEVSLKKGDIVQNKETGDKFMVHGNKLTKGNEVYLRPAYDPSSKKKKDQIKVEAEDFLNNYTLVENEIIEDDVQISKILTREPLSIIPKYDFAIKNKEKRIKEANDRLQKLLRELSPEKQGALKLKIRRGPKWDDRQTNVNKLQQFQFGEDPKNPSIRIQKQKLYVEIISEQVNDEGNLVAETVGFFQGSSSAVLLDGNGNTIDPLQITNQQAYDLFRTYKSDNIDNIVDKIKNNYVQAYAIEEFLQKTLNESGQEEVIIDIADLEDIGVTLSEGALTRLTGKGEQGATFGELDYKYVVTDVEGADYSDITVDGQPPYFIMDYNRDYPSKYKNKDGKWVYSKVKGNPVNNIDTTKPAGKKLYQEVISIYSKLESKSPNLKGKYNALVKLDNGKHAIVTLTPDTMSLDDVDNFINVLQERSKDTHDNHFEDITYNDKWNKELMDGSPADSQFDLPGMFIAAGPGIFVTLNVNSIGGLNVSIRNFNVSDKAANHRLKSVLDFEAVQEWNNAEDMIAALTDENFKAFQPTKNSFKYPINRKNMDFNVLSLARTNLTSEVKKGFYITLNLEGSNISRLTTPIIRKSDAVKEKERSEREREKDNEVVEELTPEQRQDAAVADYENISNDQLKLIAVKLNIGENLDEFEKAVQAVHRDRIAELRIEVLEQTTVPADTPKEAENQKALAEHSRLERELKDYTIKLRTEKRAELIASDSTLYNEETNDGKIAINRQLQQIVITDPKIQELKAAVKKAFEDSFKIRKITRNFDGNDIEDINTFTDWLKANLPENLISLGESRLTSVYELNLISKLREDMKDEFITVGDFTLSMAKISNGIEGLRGVINTSPMAPFKYHEAFHSVFRMLLTEEEIVKYLGIAKKELRALYRKEKGYEIEPGVFVKSEAEALDFLRSMHVGYAEMSVKELSDVLYEEYLADRFEEFKMNPAATKTSSEVKGFFQMIIDFIKAVLGQFKADKGSQLNSLFKDIDGGKYKRAGVQTNKFTIAAAEGVPSVAYKKSIRLGTLDIRYESKTQKGKFIEKRINNVMPADQQHTIVSGITNLYLKRKRNHKEAFNKNEELEKAVFLAIEMYNPNRDFYMEKSEEWQVDTLPHVRNMYDSMLDQVEDIKDMVNERLADIAEKINLEEEDIAELEADGVRSINEWGKSSDEIGGFSSMLSPDLRTYIGLTTLNEADTYGNRYFDDAETEPLNIGVDAHRVYNGILKAVANEVNEIEIIKKAWLYSRKNPHSKAFIDNFFKDIGLFDKAMDDAGKTAVLFDDNYTLPEIKDSELYQQFINGFMNFRVDNIFWQKDSSGVVNLYSATTKDDAHHTLSEWASSFNKKYNLVKVLDSEEHANAKLTLNSLTQLMAISKIDKQTNLSERSSSVAEDLRVDLGMDISPLYLEYSVLTNILDQSNFTPEQKMLVDTFSMYDAIEEVDIEELVKSINRGENIFLDNQDVDGEDTSKKTDELYGVKSRLIKISINNAPFSESVGATVFKDPKGNLIYAHQMPTLHLEKIIEMKGADYVANKILESPFMKDNVLLNDSKFQTIVEKGLINPMRISGLKSGGILNISDNGVLRENKALDVNQKPGVQFGSSTPKEFALSLIHTYLYYYNRTSPDKSPVFYDKETNEPFVLAPIFIRVIEASNTGDFAPLAIYKQVEMSDEGLTLTDEAVEKRKTIVKQSFERAQREANPETRTKQSIYLGNTDKDNNRTDTGRLTRIDDVAELTNSLKARKNRAVNVEAPSIGDVVSEELIAGNLSTVLRSREVSVSTNLSVGENSIVDIGGMQFVMYNQGYKKFSDITNAEQDRLMKEMGSSILTADQYTNRKDKNRKMYSFRNGNQTFYTYLLKDAQWLNDKSTTSRNIFSFVPLSKDSKVQVGLSTQQITVKTIEELQERIDIALDAEDYRLVQVLKDKLDQINESQEDLITNQAIEIITGETMDVDTSVVDGLQEAIEKARTGEMVDFDTLWNELNGDDAVRSRAIQDVNEFIITLKETGAWDEISTEISEGLGQVQEGNNRKIQVVQNDSADRLMAMYNMEEGNLDYNLAQIFLNDQLNTIGINQLVLGDEAYSLKDAVDKIKRAKMQNAAGPNASSLISDSEIGINHETDIIKQLLFNDEKIKKEFDTIIESDRQKEGQEGDRTDGQMYITTKSFKHFMFGFGKWNKTKNDILEKIVAGNMVEVDNDFFGGFNKLSYKEQDMIMNSLKLVYADGQVFLKMSAFVLTPEFTSVKRNGESVAREGRTELHNLRVKLEKFEQEQENEGNGIVSIAVPATASKMMKMNMQDTQAAYDDRSLTNDMTTDLRAKYMRLQLINPSNKVEVIDPRQIKNLITSEQKLDELVNIAGTEMSIADVINLFHNTMSDRVENEFFKRRNLVFSWAGSQDELIKAKDAGKRMTTNLTAFLKYAIKGLEASQAKSQMLDYFGMDEFGEPKYDLNNQLTVKKFQELFLSFFSKGVLAERQPGISAALVSDAGFKVVKKVEAVDKDGVPIRWTVIRSNDWEGLKNLDPNLKAKTYTDKDNETFSGLKRNEYYLDHLRSGVMEYDSNDQPTGIKYTEFVMPPHFKSILENPLSIGDNIPDAIAKMFGIRIPSQDKHSAVNLKLVDFLPVYYGSSAIFSRDLVEISGADFDIDKLYMHIKDFYVQNGEFIEYGSAERMEDAYYDYIKYTLNEYGKKNSSLYMAVEEVLRREKSLENVERLGITEETANMSPQAKEEFIKEYLKNKELKIKTELFDLLASDTDLNIETSKKLFKRAEGLSEAMTMLGQPVSFEEYKAYRKKHTYTIGDQTIMREPYKGAQDNVILDTKIALLGNKGMSDPRAGRIEAIASEPAVLTPLTDEAATDLFGEGTWQYIQRELPELAEEVNETGIDINNINGKITAWDNNKEGARSIGAVVLPNILINILQEHGIKLRTKKRKGVETFDRLSLNGNNYSYDDFGVEYTIDPKTGKQSTDLYRKQFVVSALVTAMTDNAKERLAKKLGLTKNSLATVTTMLALGVDIKTITLLVKHPTIAFAFDQIKNGKVDGNIKTVLQIRKSKIKEQLEKITRTPVISLESLTRMNKHFNAITDGTPKLDKTGSATMVGIDTWSIEELQFDFAAIDQFLIAYNITESIRNMTELVNLQKGLGRDLEAMQRKEDAAIGLGLKMTNKEFEADTDILVDVRSIFKKGRNIHATNYKLFRESYDYLAPAVFLQRTKPFEKIYNTLIKNLEVRYTKPGKLGNISIDLIAYLNTKSYIHRTLNDSYQSWQGASLQNGMIYDNKIFSSMPQGALSVDTVVERVTKYLNSSKKNNHFIDKYITLRKTNNEDNFSGISQINSNTWTRIDDAELSRIQNSFLELYQDPNTHHDAVHMINYLLVKDGFRYGPNTFMSALPASVTDDIINTINDIHLLMKDPKINNNKYKKLFGVPYEELTTQFLEDYMSHSKTGYDLKSTKVGGEVSSYNTEEIVIDEKSILVDYDVAEGDETSQVLSNLAQRVFKYKTNEYGSVIHAFQVLRKGKFDKKVDKEYKKHGIDEAHGKVIETKLSKKRGSEDEMILLEKLIRASFINTATDYDSNGTEIRTELMRGNDFRFSTNTNIDKVTKKTLLSLQKDMVYNNLENGEQTIISKAGIKTQEVINKNLKKNPVIRDNVEKTVTVDVFKGVKKGDKSDQIQKNIYSIAKGSGFKTMKAVSKTKTLTLIQFPYVIEMGIGKGKKGLKDKKLYKLVSYKGIDNKTITDPYEMIDNENNIAVGNYAEYVEVEQVGSLSQNAIGLVLGKLPAKKEIDKYLEDKKNMLNSVMDPEQAAEEAIDNVDVDNVTPEAQSNETATEETENEKVDITLDDLKSDVDIDNIVIVDQSNEVAQSNELTDVVAAWLQTSEGSLDNQTAEQSAGKFAVEFSKRSDLSKKIAEKAEEDITGGDLFDMVGQGMNVMDKVQSEIERQTQESSKLIEAGSFFSQNRISSQAKGNDNDSKLEKEWDKLTPEQKMGAANLMKMYNAQDLIAAYNKTNAKVDISISKFMENLKCNI